MENNKKPKAVKIGIIVFLSGFAFDFIMIPVSGIFDLEEIFYFLPLGFVLCFIGMAIIIVGSVKSAKTTINNQERPNIFNNNDNCNNEYGDSNCKTDQFYHTHDVEGGIPCPKCKTPMPKDNLYCDNCGNRLRKECFYCGHINKIENTICEECGSKL